MSFKTLNCDLLCVGIVENGEKDITNSILFVNQDSIEFKIVKLTLCTQHETALNCINVLHRFVSYQHDLMHVHRSQTYYKMPGGVNKLR